MRFHVHHKSIKSDPWGVAVLKTDDFERAKDRRDFFTLEEGWYAIIIDTTTEKVEDYEWSSTHYD